MKLFISATLFFASHFSFANMPTSIHLEFNGPDGFSSEVYEVPDKTMTSQLNLVLLSSASVEFLCYNGDANDVIKTLDSLVTNAGTAVKNYEGSIRANKVFIKLSVLNMHKKIQNTNLEVAACN